MQRQARLPALVCACVLAAAELIAQSPVPAPTAATGSIAGAVFDASGTGMPRMLVRLRRIIDQNRSQILPFTAVTDAAGSFTIADVPPGEYLLESLHADMRGPSVYYPSAPPYTPGGFWPQGAGRIQVTSDQRVSGIDVTFRPRRIAGRVVDVTGQPMQRQYRDNTGRLQGRMQLTRAVTGEPLAEAEPDADGRFQFDNLEPGAYLLRANITGVGRAICDHCINATAREFSARPVAIASSDVGPVELTLQPTGTVKGRLVFEGQERIDVRTLAVTAVQHGFQWPEVRSAQDAMLDAVVYDDGSFEIGGLVASMLVTIRNLPRTWFVKSVSTGRPRGPDELIPPDTKDDIVLVLSPTAATVTGRVLDPPPGSKPLDLLVYLFSTDERQWFDGAQSFGAVQLLSAGIDGDYAFESVPPGDYYVAAVLPATLRALTEKARAAQLPPDGIFAMRLKALAGQARRIAVTEQQKLSVNVPVIQLPN